MSVHSFINGSKNLRTALERDKEEFGRQAEMDLSDRLVRAFRYKAVMPEVHESRRSRSGRLPVWMPPMPARRCIRW